MKKLKTNFALALMIAGMLVTAQVAADKPFPAGGGDKGGNAGQRERPNDQKGKPGERSDHSKGGQRDGDDRWSRDRAGSGDRTGEHHFGDQHRTAVRDYYSEQHRRGFCPPGLAKKDNGCQPPGQAKKWTAGRPLPRDVVFHDLPPSLVRQFDRPPAGQRYVRVGSDILLIGNGTGTVFDAIPNLGRM
jgi:Ni/Co efflux regulator RcnB